MLDALDQTRTGLEGEHLPLESHGSKTPLGFLLLPTPQSTGLGNKVFAFSFVVVVKVVKIGGSIRIASVDFCFVFTPRCFVLQLDVADFPTSE